MLGFDLKQLIFGEVLWTVVGLVVQEGHELHEWWNVEWFACWKSPVGGISNSHFFVLCQLRMLLWLLLLLLCLFGMTGFPFALLLLLLSWWWWSWWRRIELCFVLVFTVKTDLSKAESPWIFYLRIWNSTNCVHVPVTVEALVGPTTVCRVRAFATGSTAARNRASCCHGGDLFPIKWVSFHAHTPVQKLLEKHCLCMR